MGRGRCSRIRASRASIWARGPTFRAFGAGGLPCFRAGRAMVFGGPRRGSMVVFRRCSRGRRNAPRDLATHVNAWIARVGNARAPFKRFGDFGRNIDHRIGACDANRTNGAALNLSASAKHCEKAPGIGAMLLPPRNSEGHPPSGGRRGAWRALARSARWSGNTIVRSETFGWFATRPHRHRVPPDALIGGEDCAHRARLSDTKKARVGEETRDGARHVFGFAESFGERPEGVVVPREALGIVGGEFGHEAVGTALTNLVRRGNGFKAMANARPLEERCCFREG